MRHFPRLISSTCGSSLRSGSILPALAVTLVVVLGGAALVLDRVWLDAAHRELLTAAEDAALAAGQQLANDDLLRDEADPAARLMKARWAAARIAGENTVAGEPLVLNTELDGDVRFGKLCIDEASGETIFLETDSHPMSIAVRARRTAEFGTPIPLPFRSLLGPHGADSVVVAEATLDNHVVGLRTVDQVPIPTLPLAILASIAGATPENRTKSDKHVEKSSPPLPTWSRHIEERQGADQFSYDSSTGEVTQDSDGIPEITLRTPRLADRGADANAFVVALGGDLTEDRLRRQVEQGWSAADLDQHNGQLWLNAGVLELESLKGVDASVLADALRRVIGQKRICLLYDQADCDAGWAEAHVHAVGFVAGRVMSVREVSHDVCEIVLQPAVMTTRSAVVASEIDAAAGANFHGVTDETTGNKYVYKLRLSQ